MLGGTWLAIAGLLSFFRVEYSYLSHVEFPSLLLFVLTILVTPANIYMYTHGARLPIDGPEIPVVAHYVRLAFQVLILSFLYILAEPSIISLNSY